MRGNFFKIGITGHRDIASAHVAALEAAVRAFYERYLSIDSVVLSSLAKGADQLCARVALQVGLSLVVPLPMEAVEYRKDFSPAAAETFDDLCAKAQEVFVVTPCEENVAGRRGFYYRQAGLYIAAQCDVMLALWDGKQALHTDGAGTFETIRLAKMYDKEVWQLATPRAGQTVMDEAFSTILFEQ